MCMHFMEQNTTIFMFHDICWATVVTNVKYGMETDYKHFYMNHDHALTIHYKKYNQPGHI
jgi:hypothetical protein